MQKDYVCVIGGANVDIACTAFTPIKTKDSNPGTVRVSCGGVGRNIAENLARLGVPVKLITVLGNDANAQVIRQNAQQVGIDLTDSLVVDDASSTYIAVNDVDGDMYVAISAMDIVQRLTPEFLATKLDVINSAKCVVVDANLYACLGYIRQNVTAPIFFDTVSAKKTDICKGDIADFYVIKPNEYEAQLLSDVCIMDDNSALLACQRIASRGIANVLISCGDKGIYAYDGKTLYHVPCYPTKVVNTTGAGDSFMAGLVYGYMHGKTLVQSTQIGCVASTITISDHSTVSQDMTVENINKILEE